MRDAFKSEERMLKFGPDRDRPVKKLNHQNAQNIRNEMTRNETEHVPVRSKTHF